MNAFVTSLLFGLLVTAAPPRLDIDLVFTPGAAPPPYELATALDEATQIWASYGVDVRVVDDQHLPRPSAVTLTVAFVNDDQANAIQEVVGSILFRGDAPRPSIVLHPAAATDLVISAMGPSDSARPLAFYQQRIGRALGRALAHEIGHYLLRSRAHSATGLMRAKQPSVDLFNKPREYCTLSADEVRRLEQTIVEHALQTP